MRKHPYITTDGIEFVPPKVAEALLAASKSLTTHNIRHAICGGLAVLAYGHVRATRDVDFLVGDEAFVVSQGGVAMLAPGVPYRFKDIPTDMVALTEKTRFLETDLNDPYDFAGLPVVSPECLVVLKLIAYRRRDQDDILALIENGTISRKAVRKYIRDNVKDAAFCDKLIKCFDALQPDR